MSDNKQQFSLALESRLELKTDQPTFRPTPVLVPPAFNRIIAEIGPLPSEALFLGVASDGLPVLLNLHDPVPGSLLILGESGAGKTGFLRSIAHYLLRTHAQEYLQYGVVTNHPDEWEAVNGMQHQAGVFSVNHTDAQEFMFSLVSWARENKDPKRSILLLIDDLETVARLGFDALQNLRWLLVYGPARRVWPIISMNAERYGQVLSWIPIFRTRVFGRIRNERVAEVLSGDKTSGLDTLEAPIQFSLRENGKWIKFWLPGF